jgi:signal transduction histidine kinase
LAAAAVFVLFLAGWARLSGWYARLLSEETRSDVELDASVRANAIASGLSRRLLLLEGFGAFAEVMAAGHASESQMAFYVQTVFPTVEGIHALGLAPEGEVSYAFPEGNNEHFVGLSFFGHPNPTVARAAISARDSGDLVLVGPVDLGYPEPVLLGLRAIYNEGDLWGFVALVADLDPLLALARLDNNRGSLSVALRAGNGLLIHGEPETLEGDPVLRRVEYPDGAWQLAAAPTGGWQAAITGELRVFQVVSFLTGLLGTGTVYLALRRQFQLSQTVEEKIAEAESAGQVERSRLARELHDSVSQALYGIALGARTLRRNAEEGKSGQELFEPVDYITSLAQGALAEMRSLLMGLRPEELEEHGLSAALERLGDALAARNQILVETRVSGEPALALEEKIAVYRIAQEATHNATKHAEARSLWVTLQQADGWVVLEVRDDGRGFDPAGEYPGHLGMKTMRERAELLGGQLTVESRPGGGTNVRVVMPLESGRTKPSQRENQPGDG